MTWSFRPRRPRSRWVSRFAVAVCAARRRGDSAVALSWTHREEWRARHAETARVRRALRAAKAAEVPYQRQLAAYAQALAAHRTALTAWEHQRRHLNDLLSTASRFQHTTDAGGLLQLARVIEDGPLTLLPVSNP